MTCGYVMGEAKHMFRASFNDFSIVLEYAMLSVQEASTMVATRVGAAVKGHEAAQRSYLHSEKREI